MSSPVRPELPTASVGSSQAPTAAVDNSAPFSNRPQSTYKSGNAVQTNGATSVLQCHAIPELHAGFDRHVVADAHIVLYEHHGIDVAVPTYPRIRQYDHVLPDLRAFANVDRLNVCARVNAWLRMLASDRKHTNQSERTGSQRTTRRATVICK
jgi:hypothetical protein